MTKKDVTFVKSKDTLFNVGIHIEGYSTDFVKSLIENLPLKTL